ncbi:MAG TPA: T9SS type A sorting domain-containing protein [Puia sp.]|uniref:T9SS type A sorting domain-containing protein n=1 Tax=Puia sp. TaxID=2045100 RepID=UPI002C073F9E|nr:T9SS type A sorting domain-containing protein [Puia sp.]HVU96518.1 T9SS type A sorting domain-containing protein [Puia sp.]
MKNHARLVVLLLFAAFQWGIACAQSVSGVVNGYYPVTTVNMAVNAVTLTNATGLGPGQRVMLYQAKGAAITASNTSHYGDVTALNNAGAYEMNTICSVSGNEVWLVYPMLHSYDPSGLVQLLTVPSSPSITIAGALSAASWDPATGTGGIVALESSGSIFLNADINVSGQGLQGGALVNYSVPPYDCNWAADVNGYYYPLPASGFYTGGSKGEGIAATIVNEEFGRGKLANGGGGGNNANAGGAGGGNYGPGGDGGQRSGENFFDCHGPYPGIGGAGLNGLGYSAGANRIFLGGGGGSGQENNGVGTPGANGGGIILLSAPAIVGGGGRLLASGLQPVNPGNSDPTQAEGDGGGGGGAGGAIILNATTVTGTIIADVTGGPGSNSSNHVNDCTGPGGGGAGGVVWAAGGVFPPAVSAAVSGGLNGVVSSGSSKTSCVGSANGATSGAPGISQAGYVLPTSGGSLCTVLANSALLSFTATRADANVLLDWTVTTAADSIKNFVIQRSVDGSHFDPLATVPVSTGQPNYHYTDAAPDTHGQISYRLAWLNPVDVWSWSRIVTVAGQPGPDAASLRLYPNPAKDQLTVTVISRKTVDATVTISNALGQVLHRQSMLLHNGSNSATLPLGTLSPGAYFLVLASQGMHLVRSFVKKGD